MAGRKTKVTPAIEVYVRQRRSAGLAHKAIVAELAQMGTPLSVGAVHKIAPGAVGSSVTSDGRIKLHLDAKPEAPQKTPPRAGGAVPDAIPDDASMAELEALQRNWQAMSAEAERVNNVSAYIALQRLLRDVVVQKRKFRPPPIEKPEENPDMIRAAERAAERLHRLIDEALRADNEMAKGTA